MSDHDELRAKAEAAYTPGPWAVDEEYAYSVRTFGTAMAVPSTGESVCDTATPEDAAYIAAANPAVVRGLLDEIDRLRALAGCGGHGPQGERRNKIGSETVKR